MKSFYGEVFMKPSLIMFVTSGFLEFHEIFKNFLTEHLWATAVDLSINENKTFRKLQYIKNWLVISDKI